MYDCIYSPWSSLKIMNRHMSYFYRYALIGHNREDNTGLLIQTFCLYITGALYRMYLGQNGFNMIASYCRNIYSTCSNVCTVYRLKFMTLSNMYDLNYRFGY